MSHAPVIVVGAGLGGLSAAIRLRLAGYDVVVYERLPEVGGRANVWESEGFRFDTGPTLLLMTEYVRGLFEASDRRVEDYLDIRQLDPNYRIAFADGSDLVLGSRLNALLDEVERIEAGAGGKLLQFLAETRRLYQIGLRDFVDRNFLKAGSFFSLQNLGLLLTARVTQKLYKMVSRYFKDERLRRAFSFQSMYLGLSPYDSPAIYSLLPYTEMGGGLFFPMGGMHALPKALARLARDLGVVIHVETEVQAILKDAKSVRGVRLQSGEEVAASVVVVNADLPFAYRQLLNEPHPRSESFNYTCGAFLMFLGVKKRYPKLLHHTLVVPKDLPANMDAIFKTRRVQADPAYYICNPSKTDPSLAPDGCENIYILVPVPHESEGLDWGIEGPRLREAMLDRLERFGLTDLRENIVTEKILTPREFRTELYCEKGAAFGLAHGMDQVGYLRPHNRHASLENLYFVGASTHPGTGIPMVLISGRLVAERIALEQPVSSKRAREPELVSL
jgi:phytoene desaturase